MRNLSTCRCGATFDRGKDMEGYCPGCLYYRYEEVWSHSVNDRSVQGQFRNLLYGNGVGL